MLSGLLLSGLALAKPWAPGEARTLDVAVGEVTAATAGVWANAHRVVVGDADGLTIVDLEDAGTVAVPIPIADVRLVDLDGDGSNELVTCGASGMHVVKAGRGTDGLGTVELTDQPCAGFGWVDLDTRILVLRTEAGLAQLAPRDGELVLTPVPDVPPVDAFAVNGRAIAALGEQLHLLNMPGAGANPPIEDTVGVVLDGGSFASLVAGPSPRIVRSNGTEVALPHAPDRVVDGQLGAFPVIALDGPAFVELARPAQLHQVDGRLIAAAELTGDACSDIVLATSQLVVVEGICAAPEPGPDTSAAREVTGEVEVGERWPVIEVRALGVVEIQLVDTVGAGGFELTSGPSGLGLSPEGLLTYRPTVGASGLWRVAFTVDGRHSGVILRVAHPGERVVEQPLEVRDDVDPRFRNNTAKARSRFGFFGIRDCAIGFGGGGGISKNTQSSWSNVGLPDWVPSGSPAVLFACTGGGNKVRWSFGTDFAPTYFYLAPGGRMNHFMAGTIGMQFHTPTVRVGPIVSAGLLVFGVGLKAQVLPFEMRKGRRHGLELRALTYPAVVSIHGILAYTVEIGDF